MADFKRFSDFKSSSFNLKRKKNQFCKLSSSSKMAVVASWAKRLKSIKTDEKVWRKGCFLFNVWLWERMKRSKPALSRHICEFFWFVLHLCVSFFSFFLTWKPDTISSRFAKFRCGRNKTFGIATPLTMSNIFWKTEIFFSAFHACLIFFFLEVNKFPLRYIICTQCEPDFSNRGTSTVNCSLIFAQSFLLSAPC